jgi:hypothetical protein
MLQNTIPTMRRTRFYHTISASLIASAVSFGTAAAADRALSFTQIDYPGAIATRVVGINAGGDMAGLYTDASGQVHGFALRKGAFTSVDYPGAALTEARGIGPAGDIVGDYRMPGEPALNFHGFLLTAQGQFVPIDHPDHISTMVQRILPDGSVLGCYHDHDAMASMHGFLLSQGQYSDLSIGYSWHLGATPGLGEVVGSFYDTTINKNRAYVIRSGSFTALDFPGANSTGLGDVNPAGAIVGSYSDGTGSHGFLLENGEFTSILYPGAGPTVTVVNGINAGGVMAGRYVDSTGTHGFVASPTPRHEQ